LPTPIKGEELGLGDLARPSLEVSKLPLTGVPNPSAYIPMASSTLISPSSCPSGQLGYTLTKSLVELKPVAILLLSVLAYESMALDWLVMADRKLVLISSVADRGGISPTPDSGEPGPSGPL